MAEAAGKDFASGAIAAGANEALATELRQAVTRLSPKNRDALLVMSSQLVGLVAAGLVKPDGKGMETGAWIAKNATQYNFLNHERTEDLVEDIHSCKGKPSCERDMWIGSGYNKESLENLDDALKTMGPVRAKDLMTQIQGGLAALGTLQCSTTFCKDIKFELINRSVKALDSLEEVYGFGAIVVGGIAGMAGSRPGAGAVPGASSNVNKAYEYWAAVKAERVAGPKEAAKAVSPIVPGGGLAAHEAAGGHLIAKHVGQSEAQLLSRLSAEPKITGSSSFYDRTFAEKAVSQTLDTKQTEIASWLSGSASRLRLDHTLSSPVGISVTRGTSSAVDASSVRVILVRDSKMPTGYKILTGFPTVP